MLRSQSSSVFTSSSTVTGNLTYKHHRRQLQLRDYANEGNFHVRVQFFHVRKLLPPTVAVTVASGGGSIARRKSRNRFISVRSSATGSDLSSSIQPPDIPTPGSGPDKVSFVLVLFNFFLLITCGE